MMKWFEHEEVQGYIIIAALVMAASVPLPAWIAARAGYGAEFEALWAWSRDAVWWIAVPVAIGYGAAKILISVVVATTAAVTGTFLLRGFVNLTGWTMTAAATVTGGVCVAAGKVIMIPISLGAQLFALGTTAGEAWREEAELRRLYREEYRDAFASFRAFKRAWQEFEQEEDDEDPDDEPPDVDQFLWAIARLGLVSDWTRKDMEHRYRALIRDVHPDVAGPNALAAELNRARDIIKEWKGWT